MAAKLSAADKSLIKEYQEVYDWFMRSVPDKKSAKDVAMLVIKLHEDNRILEADNVRLTALLKAKNAKA
jgi:hypothetical protein